MRPYHTPLVGGSPAILSGIYGWAAKEQRVGLRGTAVVLQFTYQRAGAGHIARSGKITGGITGYVVTSGGDRAVTITVFSSPIVSHYGIHEKK